MRENNDMEPRIQGSDIPEKRSRAISIICMCVGIGSIITFVSAGSKYGLCLAILTLLMAGIAKKTDGKNGFRTCGLVCGLFSIILPIVLVIAALVLKL